MTLKNRNIFVCAKVTVLIFDISAKILRLIETLF